MKYFMIALLYAAPALAVNVSNLDEKEHVVVFEENLASKMMVVVQPGETYRSTSSNGWVYLRDKPEQRVRVRQLDRLAIWPQGNLQMQMRRSNLGGD